MTATLSPALQALPLRQARGLTLIEVLIAIGIVALLAALAAPSYRDTIDRYRVGGTVDTLRSSLSLARTEAIRRGGNVRVERLSGGDCPTLAQAQRWDCGWRIYADMNANNTWNDNPDVLIREFRVSSGLNVVFSAAADGITINRWGLAGNMGVLGFTLQPDNNAGSPATRTVCMSTGGRIRVQVGSVTC